MAMAFIPVTGRLDGRTVSDRTSLDFSVYYSAQAPERTESFRSNKVGVSVTRDPR